MGQGMTGRVSESMGYRERRVKDKDTKVEVGSRAEKQASGMRVRKSSGRRASSLYTFAILLDIAEVSIENVRKWR